MACAVFACLRATMWMPDLTTHGDVHPHPGSLGGVYQRQHDQRGACSLSLLSQNVGRGAATWECFKYCHDQKYDIVALQEIGFKPSEPQCFIRFASRHGYRVFSASSVQRDPQSWGGVLLLVQKTTSVDRSAASLNLSLSVTVLVGDVAVACVYQPPTQIRMPMVQHILETSMLLPRDTPFMVLGDFNDEPAACPVADTLADEHFSVLAVTDRQGNFLPTRFEGNRCIDYAIVNCARCFSVPCFADDAFSDHKALCFRILPRRSLRAKPVTRLRKHFNLARPSCVPQLLWQTWLLKKRRMFDDYHCHRLSNQADVDTAWCELSLRSQQCLRFAWSNARKQFPQDDLPEPPAKYMDKIFVQKGPPLCGQLDDCQESFRLRRTRNTSARLQEMCKLQRLGRNDAPCFASLWHKVQGPWFDGLSLDQNTRNLEKQISRISRAEAQRQRLSAWRESLRNDETKCFRWLKTAVAMPFKGLFSQNSLEATDDVASSLLLIKDRWLPVWHRAAPDLEVLRLRIADALRTRPACPQGVWARPTAFEWATCAKKLRSRAASPAG